MKFFTVVFTEEDKEFIEAGERYKLSEELGWWTEEGVVYVYTSVLKSLRERLGVAVHEVVEYLLERKLGMEHKWAHRIANVIEKVVSLGKAKLYW